MGPQAADAFAYLNSRGSYGVDIAAARALHPGMPTFERWLRRGGAARVSALFAAAETR